MDLLELRSRLETGSYPFLQFTSAGLAIGEYEIERIGSLWRVSSKERGELVQEHFLSPDESAACKFFYDSVEGMRWHVATFKKVEHAAALEKVLEDAGVEVWRNDIPHFNGPNDARYRVFAFGRDLRRAKEIHDARRP